MSKFDLQIVTKKGEILEDKKFESYEDIADYMLDAANAYYEGVYQPTDSICFGIKDDSGNPIYGEQKTFAYGGDYGISNLQDYIDVTAGDDESTEGEVGVSGEQNSEDT